MRLKQLKAPMEEGIFRISGDSTHIKSISKQIKKGKTSSLTECQDPHVVAGVLKSFLIEMKEPILTFELYDSFMLASGIDHQNTRVKCIRDCVDKLPKPHKLTLETLLELLHSIHLECQHNKMSAENLARIFAPSLICTPSDKDPKALISAADFQRLSNSLPVISSLIQFFPAIFSQPPDALLTDEKYKKFKETLKKDSAKVFRRVLEASSPVVAAVEKPASPRPSILKSDLFAQNDLLEPKYGSSNRKRAASSKDRDSAAVATRRTSLDVPSEKKRRRMSAPSTKSPSKTGKRKNRSNSNGSDKAGAELPPTSSSSETYMDITELLVQIQQLPPISEKRKKSKRTKQRRTSRRPKPSESTSPSGSLPQVPESPEISEPTRDQSQVIRPALQSEALLEARKIRSSPQLGVHIPEDNSTYARLRHLSKWPDSGARRARVRLSLPAYLDPIQEDSEDLTSSSGQSPPKASDTLS